MWESLPDAGSPAEGASIRNFSRRPWCGPVLMRPAVSSHTRCSAIIDRLGGAHRRGPAEVAVPARDAGVTRSPVLVGEPEIEIGQRAADRDVTDAERRDGEIAGLLVERLERGLFLGAEGR